MKKRPYEEKPCEACGKMFGPKKKPGFAGFKFKNWEIAKVCSVECFSALKRADSKPYEEKPCQGCGKMFGPKMSPEGYYDWHRFKRTKKCSVDCSIIKIE